MWCFVVFLSWPHEFHSLTHEYVVLYLSSSVNMQESWQSRGVMMKDKYSLIIILVSLNKENALVSETSWFLSFWDAPPLIL